MKYGEIHIRIEELIERAGISKTKLGQQAAIAAFSSQRILQRYRHAV